MSTIRSGLRCVDRLLVDSGSVDSFSRGLVLERPPVRVYVGWKIVRVTRRRRAVDVDEEVVKTQIECWCERGYRGRHTLS